MHIRYSTEPEARAQRSDGGRFELGRAAGYDPISNTVVLDLADNARQQAMALVRAAVLADQLSVTGGHPLERFTLSRDEYVALMLDRQAEAHAAGFAFSRQLRDTTGAIGSLADPLAREYVAAREQARQTAADIYRRRNYGKRFIIGGDWLDAAAHRAGVRAVRAHLADLGPLVEGHDYAQRYGAEWDRAHGIGPGTDAGVTSHPARAPRGDTPAMRDQRSRDYALDIETFRMLRESGRFVPISPAERAYADAYDKAYRKASRAAERSADAPPPERVAYEAGRAALRRYIDKVGLETAEIAFDVVRSVDNDGPRWANPRHAEPNVSDSAPVREPADAAPMPADAADLVRRAVEGQLRLEPGGEPLTDHVLAYPRAPGWGRVPRLVVIAVDGQHMDALRELAANRPEYSDVLWNGTHWLDYRQVSRGPDGELVTKEIIASKAEGPHRRPNRDETVAEMLAHYLRYRAEGLTELGYDAWIKQLDADAFYTKADQRDARPTLKAWRAEGRLRDNFPAVGHRAVQADPTLGPPHPAEVAHRLYTRQLMLPVQLPADGAAPAQRYDLRWRMEHVSVRGESLPIQLLSDGNGGWRVPPPTGSDTISDVLARQFQGLSERTAERLADRIGRLLQDGSADLNERGAPRGLLGRMSERLSFGPRQDGGAASPEKPALPDRSLPDEMAVDDDGTTHAAPDRAHAPIQDEWSRLDPEQVGERLTELTGLETFGFDRPGLDPEAVREYARAVMDMRAAHPHVDLRRVGIGPLRGWVAGRAYSAIDPATGRTYTDRIMISDRDLSDPDAFRDRLRRNVDAGRFDQSVLDRPIYSVFVHEYGHAMDHAGNRAVHDVVDDVLLQHYTTNHAPATVEGYRTWLRQLSGYSFDQHDVLDPKEAVPEAFRDVVLRGANASEPARLIYDLVRRAAGLPPDGLGLAPRPDSADPGGIQEPPQAGDDGPHRDNDALEAPDEQQPVFDDEWSRLDATEIQRTLEQRHGLQVIGFDNPRADVDILREFARAIDERLIRFPQIHLDSVRIEPLDDGIFAKTVSIHRPTDGRPPYAESIVLNETLATDPVKLRRAVALNVEDGRFNPAYNRRPTYSIIVHEVGHAMDTSGSPLTRFRVDADLVRRYTATHENPTPEGYDEWLRQLPRLCFDARDALYNSEALPEGFADVELNGDNASEPAKVLNAALLRALEQNGTPRSGTGTPRTDSDDMAVPPGDDSPPPEPRDDRSEWKRRMDAEQDEWNARMHAELDDWVARQRESEASRGLAPPEGAEPVAEAGGGSKKPPRNRRRRRYPNPTSLRRPGRRNPRTGSATRHTRRRSAPTPTRSPGSTNWPPGSVCSPIRSGPPWPRKTSPLNGFERRSPTCPAGHCCRRATTRAWRNSACSYRNSSARQPRWATSRRGSA